MPSKVLFIREMTLLEERFNRKHGDLVLSRYFETLSDLTDVEFATAARFIFDNDSFWPAPARFIEVARGNVKDHANAEWQALMDACQKNVTHPALSPAGMAGMRAAGGWNAVAYAESERILEIRKREFLTGYANAVDKQRLLALTDSDNQGLAK